MSITNTVLLFVLLPAVIVLVVAALSLAGGSGRRSRRYRPGRPYDFTPMWFLSSPGQVTGEGGSGATGQLTGEGSSAVAGQLTGAAGGSAAADHGPRVGASKAGRHAQQPALESGAVQTGARALGTTGGASDRW